MATHLSISGKTLGGGGHASETCSPRSLPQELVLTHAKLAMDQKKAGALRVSVL